ncbi:hypothetical protein TKK_0000837 [Trichogramma kaykai]|uniref:Integrase catalytic domain-containing protein n=1 Tax=Trichogramma kaykai TaxID=54128 RepID=A0ABD2VWV4_9HYME
MSQEIREFVRCCHVCACTKKATYKQIGCRSRTPEKPWECLTLDFMGPYPTTPRKKRYLLVVTDCFTKWVEAFVIPDSSAKIIVSILENEVFTRWGYPRAIKTDSGRQFTENVPCGILNTVQHSTTQLLPQFNKCQADR